MLDLFEELVALINALESRRPTSKRLELRLCSGKCLFLYHYWIDPVFGWMNARIQTWSRSPSRSA